jgi:hypothetical protein
MSAHSEATYDFNFADDDDDFDYEALSAIERSALVASSSSPIPLSTSPLAHGSVPSSSSSSSSSSSPSSSSSSSSFPLPFSSSSSPTLDVDADDTAPYALNNTTAREFSSMQDVTSFLEKHAASQGFEVRVKSTGTAQGERHGATFRCWCWHPCPTAVKEELIASVPPRRVRHVVTSSHGGRKIKCGCEWSVSVFRWANGVYRLGTRKLVHTGHEVLPSAVLTATIDSLRNVTPQLEADVRLMLTTGMRCTENERRFLNAGHVVNFERDTFRNLLKKLRRELGIVDSTADFMSLLEWLQSQMHTNGAIARMQVEDGTCITGVLYMSADMRHHLDRNGQVLVMDTTFKTNRFHWPLLLVAGVDEHYHNVIFAVAVLQHQTTAAFEWALSQVKSSTDAETWTQVASIFTDGDAAMAAAVASTVPHARHLRCRYHLEMNLRGNLGSKLTVVALEEFIAAWKDVIHAETLATFTQAKEKLHITFPAAVPYLEKNHWPHAEQFVECYISDVTTFGIRSTSRVESWNAMLKGALNINSTTALPFLFQALQFAASEHDRRKLKTAATEAARMPSQPRKRTFAEEVSPHLTYYAQQKVQLQFELQHNYKFEQNTAALPQVVYYVWDNRPITSTATPEERREVVARDDCMRCSCNFPVTHLLPCRHVLTMNLFLYGAAFNRGQVGQRWLRYYKPVAATQQSSSYPIGPPPALPTEPIPSFLSTSHLHAAMPARQARYGQIMGFALTICTRAAEYPHLWHSALTWMERGAKWAEDITSVPMSAAPPPSIPSSSSAEAPPRLSALHPTVAVEKLTLPRHKQKQAGRPNESRQIGQAEKAGKKQRLTASQLC